MLSFEDDGDEAPAVPEADDLNTWVLPPEEERTTLTALHITQPDGPSFAVDDGNRVRWQGWTFRVGFTPREGAVLHTVTYADPLAARSESGVEAAVRPVAYRLSVAEMVVPYGSKE